MNSEPFPPSADAARDLIQKADRIGAASRAGAGWPQIAMLLGLGAISSLSLIAFWLASHVDESLIAAPLTAMLVWLGIFMVFMIVFSRSTKRGFGRRWVVFMGIWALLWTAGTLVGGFVFPGQLWFAILIASGITLNSVIGAWLEARP
jgi:hypothetical protein